MADPIGGVYGLWSDTYTVFTDMGLIRVRCGLGGQDAWPPPSYPVLAQPEYGVWGHGMGVQALPAEPDSTWDNWHHYRAVETDFLLLKANYEYWDENAIRDFTPHPALTGVVFSTVQELDGEGVNRVRGPHKGIAPDAMFAHLGEIIAWVERARHAGFDVRWDGPVIEVHAGGSDARRQPRYVDLSGIGPVDLGPEPPGRYTVATNPVVRDVLARVQILEHRPMLPGVCLTHRGTDGEPDNSHSSPESVAGLLGENGVVYADEVVAALDRLLEVLVTAHPPRQVFVPFVAEVPVSGTQLHKTA